MRDGCAVQVLFMGEPILTIERTMLAGKSDLSDEDADAIRDAAEQLRAFIGAQRPPDAEMMRVWDENAAELYWKE